MRLISLLTYFVGFLAPLASAVDYIESDALSVCMESSNFTATYFNVMFYPGNKTLELGFKGVSAVKGKILADITLTAYGYTVLQKRIDPCSFESQGVKLCPMPAGAIDPPPIHIPIPESTIQGIPSKSFCLLEISTC